MVNTSSSSTIENSDTPWIISASISKKAFSKVTTILDADFLRLQEERSVHWDNLDYLTGLSEKYPFLLLPNSGIDAYTPEYPVAELNVLEKKIWKDFQTGVWMNLVSLELVIEALEKIGLDVSEDRASIAAWKAKYTWAHYDLTRSVPEYGSLSRRGGIMKTVFWMREIWLQTAGDDRLMEWDYDKYQSAREAAWLDSWARKFSQIQRFLSIYYARPVELRWVHAIDPGNGHNLLSYGFRFQDTISQA